MSGQEIILRSEVQRKFAISFIERLKLDPDRPFVLTIGPYRKRRSLSQNALMWKRYTEVAEAVSEYTGMDKDDIHTWAKAKFLTPKIVEIGDTIAEHYSTKSLTTAEMTAFLDKFEAWASSELGLILTNPEDRRYTDAA